MHMNLDEKVTMFASIKDTAKPHYVSLSTVFDRITNGTSKETIEKIRKGDSSLKKNLPVALFSGIF